jgi:glycosyltransferase involved in cell wall biosynthesis
MKVSVVIPAYNAERHLREALDSVLTQTHADREIVVVNDGSTDGTLDLLRDYEGRLRVFNQDNAGVSRARNRGVEESEGEWVAFLDQDDVWYGRKLEKQIKVLEEHPDASFIYCDLDVTDEDGNIVTRRASRNWDFKMDWIQALIGGRFHPFPSTVVIRKELFLEQGGFCTDFVGNMHEDVDLWARLYQITEFYFVDEPLVQYRHEPLKWVSRRRAESSCDYQNASILCTRLMALYGDRPELKRQILARWKYEKRGESLRLQAIGKKAALRGEAGKARQAYREAWSLTKGGKVFSRYMRSLLPGRFHRHLFKG